VTGAVLIDALGLAVNGLMTYLSREPYLYFCRFLLLVVAANLAGCVLWQTDSASGCRMQDGEEICRITIDSLIDDPGKYHLKNVEVFGGLRLNRNMPTLNSFGRMLERHIWLELTDEDFDRYEALNLKVVKIRAVFNSQPVSERMCCSGSLLDIQSIQPGKSKLLLIP